ncbi:bleomycin resistance protein [Microbacterium sp. zg.B48]|uniref:bleomycin resistance protein n=1 Tax=Microbacterium sp. zg.B48 TaxID=2969408 RepID=UPI0035A93C0F
MTHHDATEEPGGADEVRAARDALDGRHAPLDEFTRHTLPRGPYSADRAVPNLPARDFDTTVAFYGGFGFAVSYRDGGWLIIRRGGVELEFFLAPEHDPYSSWFMASIRVADLDGLYAAVRASGVPEEVTGIPRLIPVALREWGQRAGYLIDPDGTQLHLIEHTGQPG